MTPLSEVRPDDCCGNCLSARLPIDEKGQPVLNGQRLCKLKPPNIIMAITPQGPQPTLIRPGVHQNEWCREHERKPGL